MGFRLTVMQNRELGWMNFESKSNDFYQKGIENLVECWEKVIDTNGEYIID